MLLNFPISRLLLSTEDEVSTGGFTLTMKITECNVVKQSTTLFNLNLSLVSSSLISHVHNFGQILV